MNILTYEDFCVLVSNGESYHDKDNNTLLHMCAYLYEQDNENIMYALNILLDNKHDPNDTNDYGDTILHTFISIHGDMISSKKISKDLNVMIDILYKYCYNFNKLNNEGESVLYMLCKHSPKINGTIIKLLQLNASLKINLTHHYISSSKTKCTLTNIIEYLICDYHNSRSFRSCRGSRIMKKEAKIINIIKHCKMNKYDSELNVKNKYGNSLMHVLLLKQCSGVKILRVLYQTTKNHAMKDNDGKYPIEHILKKNHEIEQSYNMYETLINDPNINNLDDGGIMMSKRVIDAIQKRSDMCHCLKYLMNITHMIEFNKQDINGNTIMHYIYKAFFVNADLLKTRVDMNVIKNVMNSIGRVNMYDFSKKNDKKLDCYECSL